MPMSVQLRVALGQFNAAVGDIEANLSAMRKIYAESLEQNADLLIFPEMAVPGYPPEDLLHKPHFLRDCRLALDAFAEECSEIMVVVGFADHSEGDCFNAAAVLKDGSIQHIYHKGSLPNYGVFDEQRYFKAGLKPLCLQICGFNAVLTICEDVWDMDWLDKSLDDGPQVDFFINISASPFHVGKMGLRQTALAKCARHFRAAILYCNLVGGQDELVFDGRSMLVDPFGRIACHANEFAEDLLICDLVLEAGKHVEITNVKAAIEYPGIEIIDPIREVYQALVLGTRDYLKKNNFDKVLIGLSGGIDSSLVAAIAVAAIGEDKVFGVTMPSRFNSPETIEDARKQAENLGIDFKTVPIEDVLQSFDGTLSLLPGWDKEGLAYENLQARIRGAILMSMSNQFSYLVLTTGNKSETAVGYSTLYGDTAGGFAVIKDVPKTLVYKLCEYINAEKGAEIIPNSVITRPPSAELRPEQKDSDSLPDYDLLDAILKGYIEQDKSVGSLVDEGLDEELVNRVARMVDRNEYKRRQSPPGIKITPKAFGRDRRMPITNRYKQ